MNSDNTKRPCFVVEDNGLASIEHHAFSSSPENHHGSHYFLSRPLYSPTITRTQTTFQNPSFSPRSAKFFCGKFEEQPHFLDACFLCKKPLATNRDIFMYRGDTPFCSEECRAEQIDMDEAKEKNWNLSASMRALRKKEQTEKSSSPPNKTSKNYSFHSDAVAAA